MSVNPPSVQDAAVDSVDNFAVFFQLFLQNSEKRLNTDTLVEKGTGALYLNSLMKLNIYEWVTYLLSMILGGGGDFRPALKFAY